MHIHKSKAMFFLLFLTEKYFLYFLLLLLHHVPAAHRRKHSIKSVNWVQIVTVITKCFGCYKERQNGWEIKNIFHHTITVENVLLVLLMIYPVLIKIKLFWSKLPSVFMSTLSADWRDWSASDQTKNHGWHILWHASPHWAYNNDLTASSAFCFIYKLGVWKDATVIICHNMIFFFPSRDWTTLSWLLQQERLQTEITMLWHT